LASRSVVRAVIEVTVDDAGATVETLDTLVTDPARRVSPSATAAVDVECPRVGAVLAGRYLLERVLGQGGMGTVFAGRHVVTGRRVAIKVLRGDPIRNHAAALRMAREARAVGRIDHPNVVAIHDAGLAADRPFIAMELLHGESLEQRIARTGPLSEREAIDTLQQIVQGVAAAHASGIIHRDLKPANILLCSTEGLVKVVDFGISKLRGDGEDDVLVTSHGEQLGTPAFMSPEQVRGDTLDERTDIYALAVILYFALSQRFPFYARSRAEIFAKVLTARPEPLSVHRPGVSPALEAVVLKGLSRDRADRYASAHAFAEALSQCERPRSRAATTGSRVAYVIAAVSGVALIAMPTRLMHAAPSLVQLAQVTETARRGPSAEPAPQPELPPQPSAAIPQPAPERKATTLPRARTRDPRPRTDSQTHIPDDDSTVGKVKLMSW
jgi:serine/threonine protein kinase